MKIFGSRRRILRALVPVLALTFLAGCAVPSLHGLLARHGPAAETVVTARGPLSPEESRAIIAKLGANSDLLQRHLAIEQALSGAPLSIGNRTRILHDGPQTFAAMFAAIRSARRNIELEYYIFENVSSGGQSLVDLLTQKRREGVSVAILYDSYGSMDTPASVFAALRGAGIQLLEFHPVDPLKAGIDYNLNDRDHRKILDVDGRVAIVGGVNLYSGYQAHPHARLVASDGAGPEIWHDTDLEIDGPAAAELQQVFFAHWAAQKGPSLPPVADPPPPGAGSEAVRIIASDHDDTVPKYYATILSAMLNAEQRIWITTAYFVPTDDEMDALVGAARRGVDVRLMLPGTSDSQLALAVGHSDYGRLLAAGVKIYELRDGILHSKTATIDGVWSVIGSSNFDHRSVLFNDEVDAVVLGRDTAQQLEALFRSEEENLARPVTLAEWEQRGLGERLREFYSTALAPLL